MGRNLLLIIAVASALVSCGLAFIVNKVSSTPVNGASWMSDNIDALGSRTLRQICIPGSHDAGMSVFSKGTSFAFACNTLTQSVSILEQLKFGARYFDVRPVLDKGVYYTGHYTKLPFSNYQGANGQSMQSIVDNINDFIKDHNELVFVRLDKSVNYDSKRKFNSQDWDNLFQLLSTTKNLYITTDVNIRLPAKTLGELTDNGNKGAVLYLINEEGVNLGSRLGQGFFYFSSLDPKGKYSKTSDLSKMIKDQFKKLGKYGSDNYFLLAWTLTQGFSEASLCSTKAKSSIIQLSYQAKNRLWDILNEVNANKFPNILYVDNIVDHSVIDVVMEINRKLD